MIYFIRAGTITTNEKNTFINNIKKINPKCSFKLVELINHSKKDAYFISELHFISINLYNYKIKNIDSTDWTTSYWNWEKIFNNVQKL